MLKVAVQLFQKRLNGIRRNGTGHRWKLLFASKHLFTGQRQMNQRRPRAPAIAPAQMVCQKECGIAKKSTRVVGNASWYSRVSQEPCPMS